MKFPATDRQFDLVVTDLDGTLLGVDHRVSAANNLVLQECTRRGIIVMLASGRSFFSVRPIALELGLLGPQISLNGGLVAEAGNGSVHSVDMLEPELLQRIIAAIDNEGLEPIVFAPDGAYARHECDETRLIEAYGEPKTKIVPELDHKAIKNPVKVIIVSDSPELDKKMGLILGPGIQLVRSGRDFLEFFSPVVSKGHALAAYISQTGIARERVFAIGDNDNDVTMLQTAGFSVAVANATPAVKAVARAQTLAHDLDGFAVALKEFVL